MGGLLAGVAGGMGMGGGTILIPILVFLMSVPQHNAQSTNLISFFPTAVISLIIHIKNKLVDFKLLLHLIIPGIIGALGGSMLSSLIKGRLLGRIFGVFLLIIGLYEIFGKKKGK